MKCAFGFSKDTLFRIIADLEYKKRNEGLVKQSNAQVLSKHWNEFEQQQQKIGFATSGYMN